MFIEEQACSPNKCPPGAAFVNQNEARRLRVVVRLNNEVSLKSPLVCDWRSLISSFYAFGSLYSFSLLVLDSSDFYIRSSSSLSSTMISIRIFSLASTLGLLSKFHSLDSFWPVAMSLLNRTVRLRSPDFSLKYSRRSTWLVECTIRRSYKPEFTQLNCDNSLGLPAEPLGCRWIAVTQATRILTSNSDFEFCLRTNEDGQTSNSVN